MTATKLRKLEVRDAFWTRARHLICASVLAALLSASPAVAQSDAASKAKPVVPTLTKDEIAALEGLTVTAGRTPSVSELTVTLPLCPPAKDQPDPDAQPPKLLSSYPARGATVRSGLIILRLTFDKPMNCAGLINGRVGHLNPCPGPLTDPLFSRDRRTFLTVCMVQATIPAQPCASLRCGAAMRSNDIVSYGLRLDQFSSLSGQPLAPSDLDFFVYPEASPVKTIKEAVAQDRFLREAEKAAEQRQ